MAGCVHGFGLASARTKCLTKGCARTPSLVGTIEARSANTNVGRVVVLATGSSWNHTLRGDGLRYGDDVYESEREDLYTRLRQRMGRQINGLILLSGDEHRNEIYHDLGDSRIAPEFIASPLTDNTDLATLRAGEWHASRPVALTVSADSLP